MGGEVNIDTSPVSGNPEATIQKAKQIRAAAQTPADPLAQDCAVTASASALEEAQAQQELQKKTKQLSRLQIRRLTPPFLTLISLLEPFSLWFFFYTSHSANLVIDGQPF